MQWYCSNPISNGDFDKLAFDFQSSVSGLTPFTIKDWMESIERRKSPNMLTQFDDQVDGSIGGLGAALGNVLDAKCGVPLFKFKDLNEELLP